MKTHVINVVLAAIGIGGIVAVRRSAAAVLAVLVATEVAMLANLWVSGRRAA